VNAGSRGYTRKQLIEEAEIVGFSPTSRLVTDWVSLGLIDRPDRHGLGRGKGTSATWPDNQRQLFLILLDKRRDVTEIATLCTIPVFVWLWWGDDYISRRQALRALTTWSGANAQRSWRRSRWTAVQLLERLGSPDASRIDREHLIELVARAGYSGTFDREATEEALRRVIDPAGNGRTVGPRGLQFTPEAYCFLTEARLLAVDALREQTVEPVALEWARAEYIQTRQEYANLVVRLVAEEPDQAHHVLSSIPDSNVLLPPTLEQAANSACIDLLTTLGIFYYAQRQHRQQLTTQP
jgi:hypothetical protein